MRFSIIIAAHKERADTLLSTVKNIRDTQEFHHEIVVVDDGENEGLGILELKYGCKILKNPMNCGVGPSRDFAVKNSSYGLLAFFNARLLLEKGWDLKAAADLFNNPLSIITPIVDDIDTPLNRRLGGGWCRMRAGAQFNLELFGEPKRAAISCYSGAFFIKKKWYDYLRGFEGILGSGLEEAFLSMKCYAAGGSVLTGDFLVKQSLNKKRDSKRIFDMALNRAIIYGLFNISYEDPNHPHIESLIPHKKIEELRPIYDDIFSREKLNAWLEVNARLDAQSQRIV